MRVLTALFLISLLAAAPAAAQSAGNPAPGERVYVRHDGKRIEGRFVTIADGLVIATDEGDAVLRPVPRMLYRHTGHTSRGKGFLVGGAIGAVVGAAAGAMIGFADGDDPPGWFSYTASEKAAAGGVLLGGAGAIVGGLLGLSFAGDKWEAVPLRPTVGMGTPADAGVVVVRFEARF